MPSLLDIYNGAKASLGNGLQSAENSIGNAWNQNVVQPVQQEIQAAPSQVKNYFGNIAGQVGNQFSPMGTGAVGQGIDYLNNQISPQGTGVVGQGIDYLDNGINSGHAVPNLWNGPSQDFQQQHPLLGMAGNVAAGFVNTPSNVLNFGINTSADVSHQISNLASGGTGLTHDQLLSPASRLGYDVAPSTNVTLQQGLGDFGGTVANIANGFGAEGAAKSVAENAAQDVAKPLINRIGQGALHGAGFGSVTGFASGLDQNQNGSLKDQLIGAGKEALTSGLTGGVIGGTLPVVGEGIKTGKEIHQNTKDFNNLSSATHTLNAEAVDPHTTMVNGVPVHDPSIESNTKIRVPEPQAEQILRNHNNVPPVEVNNMEHGNDNMVDITIGGDRQVKSWTPDREGFGQEITKAAKQGQYWHDALDKGSPKKPGFINLGASSDGATPEVTGNQPAEQTIKNIAPQDPQAAAMAQNHADVPLTNELPQNMGTGSGSKERGFVTSVKNSPEVSPEVQKSVSGDYIPGSNAEKIAASEALLKDQGLAGATSKVDTALSQETGKISPQDVSDAIKVAQAHDELGTEESHQKAEAIYNRLAEHGTASGQLSQAYALLSSRTPEGLKYSALKTLEKAGITPSEEVKGQINALIDEAKTSASGSDERTLTTQKLSRLVNSQLPRSASSAAFGLWRTGLISGPETITKILSSYGVNAPADLAARPLSALVDNVVNLFTGKRTTSYSPSDTITGIKGAIRGAKAIPTKMNTGVDLPNTGGFEAKMGQGHKETAYESTIANTHGSIQKPAFAANYDMTIAEQARTEAMNQGLKGQEAKDYADNLVKNPTQAMKDKATLSGQEATNMNTTAAGKGASAVQKIPFIGKIIAPITRVPAALGMKGLVDVSPIGLAHAGVVKPVIDLIQGKPFDQAAFSKGVGRGLVGTGIAVGGAALMAAGRLSLAASSDPKQAAIDDAEGKPKNSVYVGGTVTKNSNGTWNHQGGSWMSLNAMGPAGITLGLGGAYQDALSHNHGVVGSAGVAAAAGGKLLADQPMLKGPAGFANALSDPNRYAETLADNTIGSVVPSFVSQPAAGFDNQQRASIKNADPSALVDTIKGKIPIVRESLPPKNDIYGQPLPGRNPDNSGLGGLVGTLNPFYSTPSRNQNDPTTQELQRLYDNTAGATTAIPTPQTANQVISGNKVILNPQQLSDLQQKTGQPIKQIFDQTIASPAYQQASDIEKDKVLANIVTQVRSGVKLDTAGNSTINPGSPAGGGNVGTKGTITTGTGGSLGAGTMTKTQEAAQLALEKSNVENGTKDNATVGDKYITKDQNGNVIVKSISSLESSAKQAQYALNLQDATRANNLKDYNTIQEQQLQQLDQQRQALLKDPTLNQAALIQNQNQSQDIQNNLERFNSRGYISKGGGSGGSSGSGSVSLGRARSGKSLLSSSGRSGVGLSLKRSAGKIKVLGQHLVSVKSPSAPKIKNLRKA